ncbi:hypothetical protein MTR67_035720 [Solanum verrucosum]|uniref:ADP/ATP translocase n=1 Tax=Solanum verrucosum TaxID=315347 RepID=A0AAF0ZLU7_SOLVR|nr:hypothetical protein MTR67_035720 [Solanum verrucosum]
MAEEDGEGEQKGARLFPRKSEPWATFNRDLMAGAIMGGAVHTIVAPIERAKLLLQTQESNIAILSGPHRRFKGMLDCIGSTVKEEGVLSLWRGNGSSVLRYYPSVALNFSLKVSCYSDGAGVMVKGDMWVKGASSLSLGNQMGRNQGSGYGQVKLWYSGEARNRNGVEEDSKRTEYDRPRIRWGCLTPIRAQDLYRNILHSNFQDGHFLAGSSANFIAGSAAGCTTLIIIYPLDISHTRLAADLGRYETRQFHGIYHFLRTIHEKDGIRGIYRGLPASLHGMIVHRGLYFGGFDTIKDRMSENSEAEVPLWKRWLVAQAVTTSAGLFSYPLDTVRRRMMMQSGLEKPMYRSTFDCWRRIYKTEGFTSFYRGALSNIFRSTGAAAVLVLYDEVKKFMNWSGL